MFLLIMLYAFIGGIALCGSISLIKNGPWLMGMNFVLGIAQLILIILLLSYGLYGDITNLILILLILGLIGVANIIFGFCRVRWINLILGVAQIFLYLILI